MGFEDDGTMVSSAATEKIGGEISVDPTGGQDFLASDSGHGLAGADDLVSTSANEDTMADNTSVGPMDVCS